jgi:uncharacterized protein (DUF1501 family)
MLRRQLLHFGAFTLGGLPVSLVSAQSASQKKLVVVMLRGAVDGLSVVAPYAEPEYAASRPQIALPPPGADDGLLKLDAMFGLHPALAPLKRHWDGGQLANRLASLGEGLDALSAGLGDAYKDTVIVVVSEFGRTLRQNGNGGTDHGRGNVMWLMGGPIAGGQVLGDWPGLDKSALADGRDLAVANDFRQVLSPVLQRHLGLTETALATVLPQAPQTWRYANQLMRA